MVSITILFFVKSHEGIVQFKIPSLHMKFSSSELLYKFSSKAVQDAIVENKAHFHSIFIWEIIKQEKIYVLVAVLIMIKLIYCIAVPYSTSYADNLYYEYMATLAGEWTEEKEAYINHEIEYIQDTLNAYDDQFYQYRDGKLTR